MKGMKGAVWTKCFHLSSYNERPLPFPMHKYRGHWCNVCKASWNNKTSLFDKYINGKTQRVNESINNQIWIFYPQKHLWKWTLKFGAQEGVTYFNDCNIGKRKLFEKCNFRPVKQPVSVMWKLNRRRIEKSEKWKLNIVFSWKKDK